MTLTCSVNCLQVNTRAWSVWAGAMFLFFNVHLLSAQNKPTFEAAIATKEVVVGMPFELTFSLKNAEGERFTAPKFTGFKTGEISEMRGMSIVNGRSSTNQTWAVELTAIKTGTFTIGTANVVSGGRVMSTKPLTIKVISAATSSRGNVNVPPGADERIFVAAEFEPKKAYVGQQVTWRIRLYTQLSVEGYDIIALPGFEGFFTKEKIRYNKRIEYLSLRGKKYAVRTLHEEALFPQETGEINVAAARVSIGIEQPGTQGFLFGPKPVTLQTEPVVLKVEALPPSTGAEFTGGVGQYEWEVKTDTNSLTTDDALTLIVEVKGNGDTRRFSAPKITVPPNCEIFEPRVLEEEEYEGETEILHRKKFEYVVLPKDTGFQEIQPLLTYFDSDSNRYSQLSAAPIRFTVSAGKNYRSPNSLPDALSTEDPVANHSSLLERAGEWLKYPWLWAVSATLLIILLIFSLLRKKRTLPPKPIISQSPNIPVSNIDTIQTAHQRLANAGRLLKEGNPRIFYDELFKALQAWLSARYGLKAVQMNDIDVRTTLLQRGATPIRVQALLSVLHTCEQSVYGGQVHADQMEHTWQTAMQVVEALEREVRL